MEAKEENADVKAKKLVASYRPLFYKMSYTIHPVGIPGEAQGKSSNESWAAKQAFRDYPNDVKENIVMTIIDGE